MLANIRPSKIDFLVCVQGEKLQCGIRFLHRKTIDEGGFSYTKFCTMRPFFQGLFLVYISKKRLYGSCNEQNVYTSKVDLFCERF